MNHLESVSIENPAGVADTCAKFSVLESSASITFPNIMQVDQDYTFNCWIKSDAAGSIGLGDDNTATSSSWIHYIQKLTADTKNFVLHFPDPGVYYLYNSKLEIGTVPTDWTPAIEDTQGSIDQAQNAADSAQNNVNDAFTRLNEAQISIDALNASISSLVVGENGESMMTQTENGWRFDMSSFQGQIQDALDGVTEIHGTLSDAEADINSLKSSVSYLTELKPYVTISSDEGTPYIELGQQEGEFKVRITNTEMAFMQGTQKIAYLTNHQLYIQSSVVTDELKIGAGAGYIWKKRSNNHLGLRYVTG